MLSVDLLFKYLISRFSGATGCVQWRKHHLWAEYRHQKHNSNNKGLRFNNRYEYIDAFKSKFVHMKEVQAMIKINLNTSFRGKINSFIIPIKGTSASLSTVLCYFSKVVAYYKISSILFNKPQVVKSGEISHFCVKGRNSFYFLSFFSFSKCCL